MVHQTSSGELEYISDREVQRPFLGLKICDFWGVKDFGKAIFRVWLNVKPMSGLSIFHYKNKLFLVLSRTIGLFF